MIKMTKSLHPEVVKKDIVEFESGAKIDQNEMIREVYGVRRPSNFEKLLIKEGKPLEEVLPLIFEASAAEGFVIDDSNREGITYNWKIYAKYRKNA